MSRINRPPSGLQQLLGSQNFGENPDELLQEVRPVIDCLPFFGADLLKVARASGANVNEGLVASAEFFGRVAIVGVSMHYASGLAANENMVIGIALSNIAGDNPTEPFFVAVEQYDNNRALLSSQPACSLMFPSPLIVEAGTTVEAWQLTYYSVTPDTATLRVLYYDLEPGGAS